MTPLILFGLFAAAEMRWPRLAPSGLEWRRWLGNLVMLAVTFGIAALPPVRAATAAAFSGGGWGLPDWAAVPLGVLALDAATYGLHRVSHAVPALWRLHAVHHSDPEMDVTTTWRQHPLAVALAIGVNLALVAALRLPLAAYAAYVLLQTAVQLLAHANVAWPGWLDRALGRVLVTPEFHRLHHSPRVAQTDSNFGEVFSVWDRLFGTVGAPDGVDPAFGLERFRGPGAQGPLALVAQPFLGRPG